jgi:hypothetical protein
MTKLVRDLPLSKRTYPSRYRPGSHWAVDEAWEILDGLPVGMLPDDYRFLVAGQIVGVLLKAAERKG